MVEVSASILNVPQGDESKIFLALEKGKANYFHIDVMDGKFVKKDTYNQMLEYASYIKRISNLPLDIHFMVENVKKAIDDFGVFEPKMMTFHIEACETYSEAMDYIEQIKGYNSKVGIAVKPDTEVAETYPVLPYAHMVLVMTVEPGKGGQTFLRDMVDKVRQAHVYIEHNDLEVDIEVDGGINLNTAKPVKREGANILVAGTSILKAVDYGEIIKELKKTKG